MIKYKFIFVLIISVILFCCSSQQQTGEEYFLNIHFSGLFTISGKDQVNKSEADNLNSCWHFISNESGELTRIEHLSKGKLTMDPETGVAFYKWNYDNNRNVIKFSTYDAFGNSKDINGIALESYKYDEHNNIIEQTSFNAYDLALGDTAGFQITKMKYFSDNTISEIEFYLPRKETQEFFKESALTKNQYDRNGNLIETAHYNEKGSLVVSGKPLYATATFDYDENDNHIQTTYYDEKGKLIEDKFGVSVYKYEYDNNGNLLNTLKFNKSFRKIE